MTEYDNVEGQLVKFCRSLANFDCEDTNIENLGKEFTTMLKKSAAAY